MTPSGGLVDSPFYGGYTYGMKILQTLLQGESFQGKLLRGSIRGYCPECDLALPLQVIVVDTNLNRQKVSNKCSRCSAVVLGYTRDVNTGKVLSKYAHPKLKEALKERSSAVNDYMKTSKGQLLHAVEEVDEGLISAEDLI